MTIVKRIEPKILDMPAEGWKQHSHIYPGHSDTAYFLATFLAYLQNRAGSLVDVAEIEVRSSIFEVLVRGLAGLVQRKARAVVMNREVCSILNSHFVLIVVFRITAFLFRSSDDIPELILKLGFLGPSFFRKLESIIFLEFFCHMSVGPVSYTHLTLPTIYSV